MTPRRTKAVRCQHLRSNQFGSGSWSHGDEETIPLRPLVAGLNCNDSRRCYGNSSVICALAGVILSFAVIVGIIMSISTIMSAITLSTAKSSTNSLAALTATRSGNTLQLPLTGPVLSTGSISYLHLPADYSSELNSSCFSQLNSLKRQQRLHLAAESPAALHQNQFHGGNHDAESASLLSPVTAELNEMASRRIKDDFGLDRESWFSRTAELQPLHIPASCKRSVQCPAVTLQFRAADGTCNNQQQPDRGAAWRPFQRLLRPDYEDGISYPRAAADGGYLPAARQVSRFIFTDDSASQLYQQNQHSLMVMQFGQFVDHDLTATAPTKSRDGAGIRCCGEDIDRDPSLLHPQCMPLLIMFDDRDFSVYNISCLDFVRSAPAPLCSYGPREQINKVTSYLDGSNIYGSSESQMKSLRSGENGQLRMQKTVDGRELLPASKNLNDGCNTNQSSDDGKYCFKSGDIRVNEFVSLTAMHTIWSRQHNQIATDLTQLNPHWTDERTFQEVHRIVVAFMQHITYNEYLPIVLGREFSRKMALLSAREGYSDDYSEKVDASITNVFATAAFRMGHSQIQGLVKLMSSYDKAESFHQLHKYFFNPFMLYDVGRIDDLVRGQLTSPCRLVSTHFTSQITQHLFETRSAAKGLDLAAINIQRGRDHGLPAYNKWRIKCGLKPVTSFEEIQEMAHGSVNASKLEELYRDVEFLDLYVGGLLEPALSGGVVGPTFACLIADQFVRLKRGDRFWYERPGIFSAEQLAEIRRISLARVLCDNGDQLEKVQRFPLLLPGRNNPPRACLSRALPGVDLSFWREIRRVDDTEERDGKRRRGGQWKRH